MDLVRAIVFEVAEREGTDPTQLPPLYEVVDPDALQAFVESSGDDALAVEFLYQGYEVRVTSDGDVEVDGVPRRSSLQD